MAALTQIPSIPGKIIKSAASAVGLGGGGGSAAPAAPAATGTAAGNQPRSEADAIAAAELGKRGRASTLAAGEDTAVNDQLQRGLLKKNQRQGAASRALLG